MATLSARRRAQRGHHLHLLRQRDLRQHRRAAQQRHAAGREDQHHARRQARAEEGHHGDHGGASHPVRGHAVAGAPRRLPAQGARWPGGRAGFRFLLHALAVPDRLEVGAGGERRSGARGGRLRPVPALRGLRRPALPHQRPAGRHAAGGLPLAPGPLPDSRSLDLRRAARGHRASSGRTWTPWRLLCAPPTATGHQTHAGRSR